MAFQPVGNAAEVVIKADYQGEECVTTFGFLGPVGWTAANLNTLVNSVVFGWQSHALAQLPTVYVAFEAVGKGLRTPTDFEFSQQFGAIGQGTLGGPAMPNNVSLSLARKSGLTGRSNRGRIFWPGFQEADVTANEISLARVNSILGALEAFQAVTEDDGTWLMAVISRRTNGALRPTGVAIPTNSWTAVDRTVDSMRRRLPKRGN